MCVCVCVCERKAPSIFRQAKTMLILVSISKSTSNTSQPRRLEPRLWTKARGAETLSSLLSCKSLKMKAAMGLTDGQDKTTDNLML